MAGRSRRILYSVLSLLAVVIAGALGIYAARDNIIRYTLNPGRSFGEGAQATAPGYANRSTWAVMSSTAEKPVDVFFIYPTIYFSGEYWNAPIGNPQVRERLVTIIKPLYAAPFAASANLFVPIYRQAAPYSFMTGNEDGRNARELASTDVAQAFKAFLEDHNQDRPFIIAGYGQGALYGFRLVAELAPAERRRLVAAYLLEVAIPTAVVGKMSPTIKLCESPEQIGCQVIWHSTTRNGRGDLPRENALVWHPGGGLEATRGRELACVNPLTWTVSGRAGSPEMNVGSAELSDFTPGGTVITRAVTSADCWNGLLFTDVTPDSIFLWVGPRYRELFPSKINPFYADIKENVARRIESFAAQASLPEPEQDPAELPLDESGVVRPQ
jgi:hypothetical protein